MADDPYAKYFATPEKTEDNQVIQNGVAVGQTGEPLNLPPNTGAANIYGSAPPPTTDPYAKYFSEDESKKLPPSDPNNLTSNITQDIAPSKAKDSNDPYAKYFQSSSTPEQSGKVINLPAMPWYENLGKSAVAQAGSAILQQAEGLEKAFGKPVQGLLDKAVADRKEALVKIQDDVFQRGYSTPDDDYRIKSINDEIAQIQEKHPQRQAAENAAMLEEKSQGVFPALGVSPTDTSVAAGIGRGVGSIASLAPEMLMGPLALPATGVAMGGQAYSEAYNNKVQELKKQGITSDRDIDSQARSAASEAAVKTVPQLAAYMVGGALASKATAALLKGASPLVKGVAGGAAAAGANVVTSAGLRAYEGQPLAPTAEGLTQDILFGAYHGVTTGLNASKNPLVNEKEAKVTADADTQAAAPLTPDQEKINQQWGELKKQAADVANQLGNLPEDHPDRPALMTKAEKIAGQMQQLRAGNPIELEIPAEKPKGDERFQPKPNETTTQNQEQKTSGVSSVEGVSAETKPEGQAEKGTAQPQGEGTEVGGQGETTQTTEAELRSAMPNTAFFNEANEALQRLNSEDARTNKRPRFALPSLRDLLELKNNPAYRLADKLAGIFGKKIVLYKGEEGTKINGATGVDPALKNYIFLKVDGARPHLFTAGHELWHHIELNSPVLANSLRFQITPLIKNWAGLEAKYRAAGYDKTRFFDEHIGDFLGDAMQDPKFWNDLAKKNPKSFKELATNTIDWLNKLLYQLKDWKMGGDFTKDIQKARDMLADGLSKFAEGKDEPVSSPEEGKGPMFQQDAEEKRNKDFYSQLQRTITDKMPNKASVEQIRAIIDPAKGSGVKPDELKWSNIDGFLEGKKSVTKEEVLDYLKNEGTVKFEESTLGRKDRLAEEIKQKINENFQRRMEIADQSDKAHKEGNYALASSLDKEYNQLIYKSQDLENELNGVGSKNKTKYAQYTLPNGENYREVVLTMPEADKNIDSIDIEIAKKKEYIQYLENSGDPVDVLSDIFNTQEKSQQEELKEARADLLRLESQRKQQPNLGYTSSHFSDIPNYVAHMRLNERPDSEGRNGLFIEELQSDRHQQGREKGYFSQENKEASQKYYQDLVDQGVALFEARRRTDEKFGQGTIPDAPFRKDWSVQMFKRALRDAIASGKEWVGWTKGNTQAERYDLSKQVDSIQVIKSGDNKYHVTAYKSGKDVVNDPNVSQDKLPDMIGKELANKAIDQINSSKNPEIELADFSGVDLKVGGKGMKGFYDQILPKEIAKYVKKWGAKVEEGSVSAEKPKKGFAPYDIIGPSGMVEQSFKNRSDAENALQSFGEGYRIKQPESLKQTPIWKVEITPEMRESVTKEGQPMFQQDKPEDFKDVTKKIPEVVEAAKKYRDKKITQQEYIEEVKKYMPYREMDSVPIPATKAELFSSLKENQKAQIGDALKNLKDGDMVGLRLDIPAYKEHGVWIVSVHNANGVKLGKIVGYEPVAIANSVNFLSDPTLSLGIATGEKDKTSFARMIGEWESTTPKSAKAQAEAAMKDPSYVQLGMNPARHSWFYDRKTGKPVVSADKVIQIGGLVLAKNPEYTTPNDPRFYSKKHDVFFQQDRPTEQEASEKREEIENRFQASPVVKKTRNTIVNTFKRSPAKEAISYMRDAGDNAANIYAKENTNEVKNDLKREFKGQKDKAANALSFVIEAKGDQNELGNMRQKIANSPDASPVWKKKALDAIEFADNNFSRFDPIVQKYEQIGLHQVAQENANGIDTPVREGYVPHYQDLEEQELFGGAGAGSATGFRKMRVHDTFADSIAAGIDPKSLNATDLLQKRLASGQKSINYRSWIDSLKGTIDPASGDPIATKVSIVKRPDGSSYLQVPKGYKQETLAGQRVAIKNGYEGVVGALTDPSSWSKNMVGKTIQKTAGAGKSITLGLDTYHLGRIAIWNSLIKSLGLKTFEAPIPSYRKGATLLDQSLPELQKMIANGEIPAKWAKGIIENKRLLNLAVKTGYNVGGISDALHQDWIHKLPGLGDFNNWLFNSFQRGAMAESWLLEFQRYRNAYPKLPEADVARMVSKDLNTRYGNLGRQGILKSKTAQDTARFLFLAPQWNEGLMRTELGALGQTGKAALDAVTGKRLFAGVLARSVGGMMAAQFIANQLINYATRGTPTWENPEEGIGAKLSAWIPDLWGGPGFFLNPMSLAMETTHLLVKGYERSGDVLQTATDYLRSRSSVPMRPVWDVVTRKNYMGTPYAPGQLWKGMLSDSVPIPIAGGTIYSAAKEGISGEPSQQYAGQYQKQLFSTFGVKLEQAPSDESRVYTLANHFKLDNNIEDRAAGYNSPYSELNHALIIGNMTTAKDAMTKILETRTPAQIEKYYKQTYPSMRLLESNKQQKDFLESLNEEQRSVYDRAKEKRKDTATSALDLLRDLK
jgi:hypothetical protein